MELQYVPMAPVNLPDLAEAAGAGTARRLMAGAAEQGDGFAQIFKALTALMAATDGEAPPVQAEVAKRAQKPGEGELLLAMLGMLPPLFSQQDSQAEAVLIAGDGAPAGIGALTAVLPEGALAAGDFAPADLPERALPETALPATEIAAFAVADLETAAVQPQRAALWPEFLEQAAAAASGTDGAGTDGAGALRAVRPESEADTAAKDVLPFIAGESPATVTAAYQTDGGAGSGERREFLLGQERFQQAVRAVRSKLTDKDGADREIPALTAETLTRPADRMPAMLAAVRQEVPDIPQQLFRGLSANLPAGKGEFVLKLEPEGLGEVTVRLLEQAGKTTLRLVTASAETARLINNDLAALQEALRPIQVEVHQAVSEAQAMSGEGAWQDQFAMFQQQNGGQGGGQTPRHGGGAWEDDLAVEGLTAPGPARDGELDLYV